MNDISKYFVPYHISKMAKDAGFCEGCIGFYNPSHHEMNGSLLFDADGGVFDNWNKEQYLISAPLYDQLNNWFFEEHNLWISIYCNASGFGYIITKSNGTTVKEITDDIFFDYQGEAYDKAFEEAFKLIQKK